ncbi:hypothetical protein [Hydrogenophaga sp. PBL-H3]|uniref:hypothetical protein n=1 Tax=Hydrogenophaga sp. PBL-H3 TaxID=434010 RepID=UPI00131F72F9|nr:hypothetical protein [Hydrogenophaga sp. PBL-H3]QHE77020.1 hypothetical protein F9Z45_13670 [Hydrogenophaga sp. PBL-H3]QHE81444.1 hypothetical protein F9Z44_13670 [Hydrogenophaga sp. PBL-H3]
MPRTTIDTPAALAEALANDGWVLPPKSRCDVFSRETAKVQSMVCTSPAMKKSAPQIITALMGGTRYEQREAASALHRLIAAGNLMPDAVRVLHATGVTLVFAPWSARDDVRSIVRSVSSSLHPERVTVDGAQLQTDAAVVVPGPSSQNDAALEIRHALNAFIADVDSLWRSARRRLSGKEDTQRWFLPVGCQVIERSEGSKVCWEIVFEDIGLLERAIGLVDARLTMGKDHLLQRWSDPEDDQLETMMPSITLMANANSRDARTQMARLLQNMLFMLGRLGFDSTWPGDLQRATPLQA